jgi:hypothetical protein
MKARCDRCRFWQKIKDQRTVHADDMDGECHFNAPPATHGRFEWELLSHLTTVSWAYAKNKNGDFDTWEDAPYDHAGWPQTRGDEWCGQFKPAKDKDSR